MSKTAVFKGISSVSRAHRGSVVAIGNFDGVHTGHQKILRAVCEEAENRKARTLAMTFEPHPMRVLRPERGTKLLTTTEEKARLLGLYGMDAVLFVKFTKSFAATDAEEFIDRVLAEKLNASAVIVGHNYAFGKGKSGSTELLRRKGKGHGFGVRVVRYATVEGDIVSSTRIRHLVGWGRVDEASHYLGRPYMVEGRVVKGAGRGRSILKTPTANISPVSELLPKQGVYAVWAEAGGRCHEGVANLGIKPTFGGGSESFEVHLMDFEGELKGSGMRVHFASRLRDERKFSRPEDLRRQIHEDIAKAIQILNDERTLRPR